jgi:hypothetical protein
MTVWPGTLGIRTFRGVEGGNQVSKRAIAYVQSRRLTDPDAARVFLLLAERTQDLSFGDESAPMGLLVADTDLPGLAAEVGINADRFCNVLRQLRDLVPMDVLEHSDGAWELVYGPSYTDPPSLSARDGETVGFRNVFAMPGWESYSTWGRDEPLGLSEHAYLYAQLYRNSDNPDGVPCVWITPPKYVLTTLDQLAEAIATEIAPYEPLPLPPVLIRGWMVQ